ncbi:MAG: DUF4907 domain-containing protein [Bacteroidota bacterium]
MRPRHIIYFNNLILCLLASFLLFACESSNSSSSKSSESTLYATPSVDSISSGEIKVITFEVKDSTGNSKGWGYDIFVGDKKMIHQPIIPAVPGNNAFKTESDARKTGALAVQKMERTGTLPTLLVEELDSLGITK